MIHQLFPKPQSQYDVVRNMVQLTIRYTVVAEGSAIVLAIVTWCLKKEGFLPIATSFLFKATAISGAASALIFIFLAHRSYSQRDQIRDHAKVNRETILFETRVARNTLIGATLVSAARTVLSRNPIVHSIATYLFQVLFFSSITTAALRSFHIHQLNQVDRC